MLGFHLRRKRRPFLSRQTRPCRIGALELQVVIEQHGKIPPMTFHCPSQNGLPLVRFLRLKQFLIQFQDLFPENLQKLFPENGFGAKTVQGAILNGISQGFPFFAK